MNRDRWRRIEEVCHDALEREPPARAAFLDDACAGDTELRREVESLIEQQSAAQKFLETPAAKPGAAYANRTDPQDDSDRATLKSGTRLGAYEIIACVGVGGMGEVYKARDTRLSRSVALKVLSAHVSSDPAFRTRFEREARAVAALNHPHICTIHDVGHEQGIDFLVMELVAGESLATRLTRGPLPLDEALARGIEIADALEKAHGQGIIHRDLKPANVMLARTSKSHATQAKLLDFGLARIVPSAAGGPSVPTQSSPMTEAGAVLGTLQYMAPEQIEGRPADARTDIFAFGALLYEMVTGRRAFEGASTAAVMAAILREEPPPVHPREVGRIVRRCLAKDPLRRYQSARDLLNDLEEVRQSVDAGRLGTGDVLPTEAGRRVSRRSMGWLTLGLLAGAIAAAAYFGRPRPLALPSYRALTFQRGVVTGARFSPDGRTVYYSAAYGAEPPRVYMTRLEGTGSVRLDLPPATLLSVSPKGELALLLTEGRSQQVSSGTLARASALGGTPRPLLDDITDADWSPDGQKLAVLHNGDLELPQGHVLVPDIAVWPRISPGGDRVAYNHADGVHVVDLEGRTVLDHKFPWSFGLAWHPDGREIWFTGDSAGSGADRVLYAVSLSGERRMLAAAPGALTIHDIAKDGTRALVATGAGWWGIQAGHADRAAESTLDLFGRSALVGLSADGKWALLDEPRAVGRGLYLRSTDGSQMIRLSDERGLGLSPDGRWALTERTSDPAHLFLIPTGAGEPQQLDLDPALRPRRHARWSRDGRQIFVALVPVTGPDDAVRIYRLDPSKSWRPVTPAGVAGRFAVSPDGRSIAALDRAGRLTLYPVDGGEPRTFAEERRIPIQWSSDGASLYLATKGPFRARIYRRDLASGRVESWREIGPPDPVGVSAIGDLFLSGDGLAYVYSYSRGLNVLYLVEGLE